MRLWHYKLLPYLPDAQFKGQLRELVAIMRDWRDKETTNHLLINRVMEYPKDELVKYFLIYFHYYHSRYNKLIKPEIFKEFLAFNNYKYLIEIKNDKSEVDKGIFINMPNNEDIFEGWHNKQYLRVCLSNLYEKHHFGIGKSRITDEEWQVLLDGYKNITGEEYRI